MLGIHFSWIYFCFSHSPRSIHEHRVLVLTCYDSAEFKQIQPEVKKVASVLSGNSAKIAYICDPIFVQTAPQMQQH